MTELPCPNPGQLIDMDRFIVGRTSPPSRSQVVLTFSLLIALCAGLLSFYIPNLGSYHPLSSLSFTPKALRQKWFSPDKELFSKNVSQCPGMAADTNIPVISKSWFYVGYTMQSVQETSTGLTARLSLAGPACNAFGLDVADLTLVVDHDSDSR